MTTPSYLVIANWALGGPNLGERLFKLSAVSPDATFHIVVPVTAPTHDWTYTNAQAVNEANERLHLMLEFSERLGLTVTGEVYGSQADTDPVEAALEAIANRGYTNVVVSTFRQGISRWLKLDTVSRLQARTGIPVEHVVSDAPKDLNEARAGFDAWAEAHGISEG